MRPTLAAVVAATGRRQRAAQAAAERARAIRHVFRQGLEPSEADIAALLAALRLEGEAETALELAKEAERRS